ncbi:MAG: HAD family phosphatase [Oscillospiraceae bacterium]
MIDTVIFDIGNVLAPFQWREIYEELFFGEVLERISDITVRDTALWNEMDRGTVEYEALLQRIIAKEPRLEQDIRRAVHTLYQRIAPYDYASSWVKALKEKGLRVYALSNYGKVPFEQSRPRFPFLEDLDGMVISYEVQQIKPAPPIFNILCEKYAIVPQNAVFIDDNADNIQGAAALHFHTILFRNKPDTDKELEKLGI